jgi:pimeloyl-ACP methyl ester carboxylesterase
MNKIYVDDVGKGFPLVLVHGYLGSSEMWLNQKDYFSKFCRVIIPALPGFGESYNCISFDSIKDMALKILEVLDEKKIKKFNLMGHSMGGMIAQEMTKIAGSRVNKLICFATGSIGELPGRFETIDKTREKLKKDGTKITFSRAPKKWFVKGDQDKNYYLCKNAIKNVTLETADNALIAMKNWKGIDDLKNIKNDTLIIWGNKDTSYNFDKVETLNKNIENSKLEIFENCSHNVHLEEVEKFNILVKDFIH